MSWLFTSGGQSIGTWVSVLLMNIQGCFPLGLTGWSSCSQRDSQESSPTPQKASILQCSAFFLVQLSYPYVITRKTIAMIIWTFVGKVMSLFFALHIIALCRYCVFYNLKFCGHPVLNKSIGDIFPIAFAHCVSLYHIFIILGKLQSFCYYYIS